MLGSLLIAIFISFPVFADDEKQGFGVESITVEEFQSELQTRAGSSVDFPEIRLKGTLRIDPRWRIFLIHYRGSSRLVNGFQASVGDFEGRVAYRLDDPKNPQLGDSPFQDVHVWASWDVWTSNTQLNGSNFQERDEGGGFGITRRPRRNGLSYWYTLGIYPSVRTPIGQQDDSLLYEGGGVLNFNDNLAFTLGYTLRTFRTSRDIRGRAEEQGPSFGLRGRF